MHQFLKSILIGRSFNTKKLCCVLSYAFQQDIGYPLDYKVIIFTAGFLDLLDTVTFQMLWSLAITNYDAFPPSIAFL